MNKLISLLLLTFFSVTLINAQIYKEVEPNNTIAQANQITIPVSIIDSMNTKSDNDYFKFNLPECAVVVFHVSNIPSNQQIDLSIWDAQNDVIESGTSPGGGADLNVSFLLPAGDYSVKIKDYKQVISTNAFIIDISIDDSDVCECNNSFVTACSVNLNSTIHPQFLGINSKLGGSDVDIFKFEIIKAGLVIVKASNLKSNQRVIFNSYKADFTGIVNKVAQKAGDSLEVGLLLSPGTYYIKMAVYSGGADTSKYDLSFLYDSTDLCESNNSFATACLVPPDITLHPQIMGYTSENGAFDEDYFKFNIPKCGVELFKLSHLDSLQWMEIYFYDSAFKQIWHQESENYGKSVTSALLLSPGDYYIKLKEKKSVPDSIHLTLIMTYDTLDQCECNNTYETACLVSPNQTLNPQLLGAFDEDYFELVIDSCSTQCVEVSEVPATVYLNLLLEDSLHNTIASGYTKKVGENFSFCADLSPGTYYYLLIGINSQFETGHSKMVLSNKPLAIPIITQNGISLKTSTGKSYEWYLNGNIIPEKTGQSINPESDGNYVVIITYENGCTATSNPFQFIKSASNEISLSNQVRVFPNPSNSLITIDFPRSSGKIIIINSLGQLVKSKSFIDQNSEEIKLVDEGVYYLKLMIGSEVIIKKLVIIN